MSALPQHVTDDVPAPPEPRAVVEPDEAVGTFDQWTGELVMITPGPASRPLELLDVDFAELLDAAHEDANGNLPVKRVDGRWVPNPAYVDGPAVRRDPGELERKRADRSIAAYRAQERIQAPALLTLTVVAVPPASVDEPEGPSFLQVLAEVERDRDALLEQVRRDRAGRPAVVPAASAPTVERRPQRTTPPARPAEDVPGTPGPLPRRRGLATTLTLEALERARRLYYYDQLNFRRVAETLIAEGLHASKPAVLATMLRRQFRHRDWPEYPREMRKVRRAGVTRNINEATLRQARSMYDSGLSMREVARRLQSDTGYSSVESCAVSLFHQFGVRGWECRDRGASTGVANKARVGKAA